MTCVERFDNYSESNFVLVSLSDWYKCFWWFLRINPPRFCLSAFERSKFTFSNLRDPHWIWRQWYSDLLLHEQSASIIEALAHFSTFQLCISSCCDVPHTELLQPNTKAKDCITYRQKISTIFLFVFTFLFNKFLLPKPIVRDFIYDAFHRG